jgi:sodium transport system permease protein
VTWLLPPPPELVKGLERLLSFDGSPLWAVILLGAVVPAVCEETLFRGLIYGALERSGARVALIGSTLLFALAHGSVYRLVPTAMLGLAMGLLRWRSNSLLPSTIFHALHNGLAVTLVYLKPSFAAELLGTAVLPGWMIASGLAVFVVGSLVALWPGRPAAPPGVTSPG